MNYSTLDEQNINKSCIIYIKQNHVSAIQNNCFQQGHQGLLILQSVFRNIEQSQPCTSLSQAEPIKASWICTQSLLTAFWGRWHSTYLRGALREVAQMDRQTKSGTSGCFHSDSWKLGHIVKIIMPFIFHSYIVVFAIYIYQINIC